MTGLTPTPPPDRQDSDLRRWALVALAIYAFTAMVAVVGLTATGHEANETLISTLSLAVGALAGMASHRSAH